MLTPTELDLRCSAPGAQELDGGLDEPGARYVARLFLTEMAPAWLREYAALRDVPKIRRMLASVADQMDLLLSEGFDPVAYKREINQAPVDARPPV